MSNKKKVKISPAQKRADKFLYWVTIIGLILGVLIGSIIFFITDNMFWIALCPIIFLFLGLGLGSFLGKNKKAIKKHS